MGSRLKTTTVQTQRLPGSAEGARRGLDAAEQHRATVRFLRGFTGVVILGHVLISRGRKMKCATRV